MHVTRLKTEKDLTQKSRQLWKLCWSKKKESFSRICLAGMNRDFLPQTDSEPEFDRSKGPGKIANFEAPKQ